MLHLSTYDRLVPVVVKVLHVSGDDVTLDSRFQDDLGADSLDLTELMITVGQEFGVEFNDTEAVTLRSVRAVCDHLDRIAPD